MDALHVSFNALAEPTRTHALTDSVKVHFPRQHPIRHTVEVLNLEDTNEVAVLLTRPDGETEAIFSLLVDP